MSADKGYAKAQYSIVRCIMMAAVLSKVMMKHLNIGKCSRSGYAKAQYSIGKMYSDGSGLKAK